MGTEQLVVKTAVLEEIIERWSLPVLRRAQSTPAGTIWVSEEGMALSRVEPLAETPKRVTNRSVDGGP